MGHVTDTVGVGCLIGSVIVTVGVDCVKDGVTELMGCVTDTLGVGLCKKFCDTYAIAAV